MAKASSQSQVHSPGSPYFFDDFTGTSLDLAIGGHTNRISDQVNGEVNAMLAANVSVASSILSITSKFEDAFIGDTVQSPALMHYTSGQIGQITPAVSIRHGRGASQTSGGTGAWPVIWMLGYQWQTSQPYTANDPANVCLRQAGGKSTLRSFSPTRARR